MKALWTRSREAIALLFITLVNLAANVYPWSESSYYWRRGWWPVFCNHRRRHGNFGLSRRLCLLTLLLQTEYDETWAEQRMRLLWEADPFGAIKSHVRSMLRDDNSVERFVALHAMEGEAIAATNNAFVSFYEGRFPDKLPLLDRDQSVAGQKRRTESFRLDLAYDGQCFCGWQRQPKYEQLQKQIHSDDNNQTTMALSSVQATIENAFLTLFTNETQMDVRVAGRTDAGVHAFGQVGRVRIPLHQLALATTGSDEDNNISVCMEDFLHRELNRFAARDEWKWRCWSVTHVTEKFHPSFGAHDRSYVYMVDAKAIQAILGVEAMTLAQHCNTLLTQIQGETLDYFSVSYGKIKTESSMCYLSHAHAKLLQQVVVTTDEQHATQQDKRLVLAIELTGNRFLRRMVRKLVGTVIQLALSLEDDKTTASAKKNDVILLKVLEQKDRRASAKPAPSVGLVFVGATISEY